MYVTGTRADFGLMASTLKLAASHPALELQLAVTGMHLSKTYGLTVREIEAEGLPIVARVPVDMEERSAGAMARGVGQMTVGLTDAIAQAQPDVVVVLGDRGEMLAGAIAAIHLGIPVAHLHGGERSGTVDEPVRHAITKLSHWHFVATEASRERVIRLGERPEHVWVTGAPALDGVRELAQQRSRDEVLHALGLPPGSRYVLVLFHPVVQESGDAASQTRALGEALGDVLGQGHGPAKGQDVQDDTHVVWLAPNADAGSGEIVEALSQMRGERLHRITHLPRPLFVAALDQAQALVGNSSAGIIEAASFGTPVVNIGSRQRARERNLNTVDCAAERGAIAAALRQALALGRFAAGNRYGDGHAGERIVQRLATQPIDAALLDKVNTY